MDCEYTDWIEILGIDFCLCDIVTNVNSPIVECTRVIDYYHFPLVRFRRYRNHMRVLI